MTHCKRALAWVDGALCLFVFFPMAVLHWRGTWGLQDVYFYPEDECISGWISLMFGTVGCILLPFLHPFIFTESLVRKRVQHFVIKRFYLYISGWFVMGYWRGVWNLTDYYLTEAWLNSVIIYLICQTFTFVTRTSRNNVGLPFCIALDTDRDILRPDLLLNSTPNSKMNYLLDITYGQLVIVTSGILVWRGIWNVYDAFFFPEDLLFSDLMSLVLGYMLCVQLFMLQWPAGTTSQRLDDYPIIWKILFEDIIMFAATWANLLLWRGAWDLCVHYFIPDPLIGGWISHWLGTIGLGVFQAFNSVALNGLEMDGQWIDGEGIFNTSYLRVLLKDRCLSPKRNDVEYSYLVRDAADCSDCVDDVRRTELSEESSEDSGSNEVYVDSQDKIGLVSGRAIPHSNGSLSLHNGTDASLSNGIPAASNFKHTNLSQQSASVSLRDSLI